MTSEITPEILRVVVKAMGWRENAYDGSPILTERGAPTPIVATLTNDTSLGNQIAIAQMILWLQKCSPGVEVTGGPKGKWFVVPSHEEFGRHINHCLTTALALAVFAVATEVQG